MADIDKIDLKILNVLQTQARISNQDLADQIHLSPSSCLMRVRKLEQSGVLKAYNAAIDLKKICRVVKCITTVIMHNQTKKDFAQFKAYVDSVPEVLECSTVSGAFDFFLKIASPNMERYLEISDELIECTEAELHISTHVVMDESKAEKAYPLESLL